MFFYQEKNELFASLEKKKRFFRKEKSNDKRK